MSIWALPVYLVTEARRGSPVPELELLAVVSQEFNPYLLQEHPVLLLLSHVTGPTAVAEEQQQQ